MTATADPNRPIPDPTKDQCTATSWRGTSHRPYGPGAFNRCNKDGGHDGTHVDSWSNVFDDTGRRVR